MWEVIRRYRPLPNSNSHYGLKKMHDYKQLTFADAVIAELQKLLSEPFRSIEQAEKSRLEICALLELQEFFRQM